MKIHSADVYCIDFPVLTHTGEEHGPQDGHSNKGLEVLVIFTQTSGTVAALQAAGRLAQELEAHIRLIVACEVPYVLPLTEPAVPVEFLQSQIRTLASSSHLEVVAQIYLCRDRRRVLDLVLAPRSLIVVGGKKRWWPTSEQKLARGLKKIGHDVVFAETKKGVVLDWV